MGFEWKDCGHGHLVNVSSVPGSVERLVKYMGDRAAQ